MKGVSTGISTRRIKTIINKIIIMMGAKKYFFRWSIV
jgi:hypothetical protein